MARVIYALAQCDRRADALAAADRLLDTFAGAEDADLQASLWRARVLEGMGRTDDAIAGFDELVSKFADSDDEWVQSQVAAALDHRGWLLAEGGHWTEAVAAYEQVIDRFGAVDGGQLRRFVGSAFEHRASTLADAGELEQAIGAWDAYLDYVRSWSSAAAHDATARAIFDKSVLLVRAGRPAEATAELDQLIATLRAEPPEPAQLVLLARALARKGELLFIQQQFGEVLEAFDEIVALADEGSVALRHQAVFALNNKAAVLNTIGEPEQAQAALEQLVAEFGEDAVDAFNDAVHRYAAGADHSQRVHLAGALGGKAGVLEALGRLDEAIAALTQLLDLFGDDEASPIPEVVAGAREALRILTEGVDEENNDTE
jgi:tetratricopeptide (TPR) repeat protein